MQPADLVPTDLPVNSVNGWTRVRSFDATGIAWRLLGDPGSSALPVVFCNGIACSDAYWRDIAPVLARTRRVVLWDYRGHGRSEPPASTDVGVGAVARDLATVLDAAGLRQALLIGHSYGVRVILEAAARWPERVAGLVAIAGSPGHPLRRTAGDLRAALLPLLALVQARAPRPAGWLWHGVWRTPVAYWAARASGGTNRQAPREIMDAYFAHVDGLDTDLLLRMALAIQEHGAADAIEQLAVPLLALAGERDHLAPPAVMRDLAVSAPRGELVIAPGGAHTLPAEQPAWVRNEIERLLASLEP